MVCSCWWYLISEGETEMKAEKESSQNTGFHSMVLRLADVKWCYAWKRWGMLCSMSGTQFNSLEFCFTAWERDVCHTPESPNHIVVCSQLIWQKKSGHHWMFLRRKVTWSESLLGRFRWQLPGRWIRVESGWIGKKFGFDWTAKKSKKSAPKREQQ